MMLQGTLYQCRREHVVRGRACQGMPDGGEA